MEWIKVAPGETHQYSQAQQAGFEMDGQPLFVARVSHDGGQQLGKAGRHLVRTSIGLF